MVSLVVKQGQLVYDPPLEDMRSAHYKTHLRPLLAIPINFKVSSSIFVWFVSLTHHRTYLYCLLHNHTSWCYTFWLFWWCTYTEGCCNKHVMQWSVSMLQGVSEASERPGFFKRVMDINAAGVAKAYAATEELFSQLQVGYAFTLGYCDAHHVKGESWRHAYSCYHTSMLKPRLSQYFQS